GGGLLLDVLEDVLERLEDRQRRGQLAGGRPERVDVAVVQAGQHGAHLGVYDLRPGPGQFDDVVVVADGEGAPVLEGDGLGDAELVVDGEDVGVVKDQVGGSFGLGLLGVPAHGGFLPRGVKATLLLESSAAGESTGSFRGYNNGRRTPTRGS